MRITSAALIIGLIHGSSVAAESLPSPGNTITPETRGLVRQFVPPVFAPFVLDDNGELHIKIADSGNYAPHDTYQGATASFGCGSALEREGQLIGFTAGQPFPASPWAKATTLGECHLDPADPEFATALAWNMAYRWQGSGITMPVLGLAWLEDNGAKVRRVAVGQYARTYFSHRADLGDTDWELEPDSGTVWTELLMVHEPFDLRGSMFLTYRYADREKDDNTWAYIPALRRVRRIAPVRRADPMLESELSLEDFHLFSGRVSDFEWSFHGEKTVIAPIGARETCYPIGSPAEKAAAKWRWAKAEPEPQPWLTRVTAMASVPSPLIQGFWDCEFAPYNALPFGGGQRFERRKAVILEAVPKAVDHATSRRVLRVDDQTMTPLYAAVYGEEGNLEKLITQSYAWDDEKRVLLPEAIGAYNVRTGAAALGQFHSSNARDYTFEEARRLFDTTRFKRGCR